MWLSGYMVPYIYFSLGGSQRLLSIIGGKVFVNKRNQRCDL